MYNLYLARSRASSNSVPPDEVQVTSPRVRRSRARLASRSLARLSDWMNSQLSDPTSSPPVSDRPQLAASVLDAQFSFRGDPSGPQISPALYQTERERIQNHLIDRLPTRSEILGPYADPPLRPPFRLRSVELELNGEFRYSARSQAERIQESLSKQPGRLSEIYHEKPVTMNFRSVEKSKWVEPIIHKRFQFPSLSSDSRVAHENEEKKITKEENKTNFPQIHFSTSRPSLAPSLVHSRRSLLTERSERNEKTYWKSLAALAHKPFRPTGRENPVESQPDHSQSLASLNSSIYSEHSSAEQAKLLFQRSFQAPNNYRTNKSNSQKSLQSNNEMLGT
jgi:hypothetical protein